MASDACEPFLLLHNHGRRILRNGGAQEIARDGINWRRLVVGGCSNEFINNATVTH